MPNATDPTGANQYNYTFQTVQDWPRNDQVLRMDWNVGPDTTFYGRLQFGYEKRSGGVSFLGSTGAGWPQMPSKYEIDTVSYVNTLLHTFNPTTVRRVHGRRELVAPVHERARPGGHGRQRSHEGPAGPAAVLPVGQPRQPVPQASFAGGLPGNHRRRSASSTGGRSSATTRCGTSRAT